MAPNGWSLEEFLRRSHRYAVALGEQHGWPNTETRVPPGRDRVWGFQSWPTSAHVDWSNILGPDPGLGISALTPVPAAWRAGHRYAQRFGYRTGMLTYEASYLRATGQPIFGLMMIKNSAGLEAVNIPRGELVSAPDFDRPDLLIRDVNRWATGRGNVAGFPTFERTESPGVGPVFGAFLVPRANPLGVHWQDVPEPYLVQGHPTDPPPVPRSASVTLFYTNTPPYSRVWVGTAQPGTPNVDRPILATRMGTPSGWNNPIGLVTHEGHDGGPHVRPNIDFHDFDGQTTQGRWVISFTATGMNIDDPVSLTMDT